MTTKVHGNFQLLTPLLRVEPSVTAQIAAYMVAQPALHGGNRPVRLMRV